MVTIAPPTRAVPHWLDVLYGGLLIALGDMAFATTLWFSWDLDGIARVFRSIAAGVLGAASAQGGAPAAWLGAGLHVAMATSFVLAYTLAARRVPRLLDHPSATGSRMACCCTWS